MNPGLGPQTPEDLTAWLDASVGADLTVGEWWGRLYEAGLSFPTLAPIAGGSGASPEFAAAVAMALVERDMPLAPVGVGVIIAVPLLLSHGTRDQQETFVGPLVRGEEAWCQLFSEPAAGSDLAGLQTRAQRDGEVWVVNGQKVWTTQGTNADRGLLLARTDPDVPKHQGITCFIIDMDQPGVEARPLRQMNGGASFAEVFMTDAHVGAGRVIGEVGAGWAVTRAALAYERAGVATRRPRGAVAMYPGSKAGNLSRSISDALAAGRAEEASHAPYALPAQQMIALARQRGLSGDPVWRQRLAGYYIDTLVRRYVELHGRGVARQDPLAKVAGPVSKLSLSLIARRSRELAFGLLGAAATVGDGDPLSTLARQSALSSFAAHFGGGTDEIQRNVIGEAGLGLPREHQVDRDLPFSSLGMGAGQTRESRRQTGGGES